MTQLLLMRMQMRLICIRINIIIVMHR